MKEEILNEYYQRIAEAIVDVIPDEWYQAALYVEDVGNVGSLNMYFKENENGEYIYSRNIPQIYGTDTRECIMRIREISLVCHELRDEFKNQGEEPWNIFKFYLKSDGTFRAEFGYEYEKEVSDYAREIVWKYKELGIEPKGEFEQKKLDEFLNRETGELKKKM